MADSMYVVVGVGGGDDGLRAVEYGAREAVARGERLLLVHAYHIASVVNPTPPWYGADARRRFGVQAIEAAHRRALAAAPGLAVDQAFVRTTPARAIVNASRCASLVVLGRHHRHDAPRLFSGSTGAEVAAKAKPPVVTVPDGWKPGGSQAPIVVGTDGSDSAHDALRFAFEAAQSRSTPLVVVRAWETPRSWHEHIAALDDATVDWREQAERELAEELAGWAADYPDVAVSRQVERGRRAAAILVGVAAGAGLLVVGVRGSGGMRALDIGGTARSVLAHAACAVAVVHPGEMRSAAHVAAG
jgi:nucleotide-binding universal stress UspA family protein